MLVSGFCLVSVSIARDVQIHVVYVFKQILDRIERNSTGTHLDKQQTNYCITYPLRRMPYFYWKSIKVMFLLFRREVKRGGGKGGREGGREGGRQARR